MQHQDSTRSEHQARNDAQLSMLRRTRPEIWTRLLETMSEAERAQAEDRADWGDVAELEAQAEDRNADAALAELELDLLDAALRERCACYATGTEQQACLDSGQTCAPAPSPEAIALAVELFATGQYDLAGAVREAEAALPTLLAEAEAWEQAAASSRDAALTAAEARNPRHDPFPAEAREIALKGPARIERRFDLLFLGDDSIWRQDGKRVVLDVPPLKYLPRHDNDSPGCAVLVISPPDDDPPPPAGVALPVPDASTETAVAVARSEALGLPLGERRGLWSFAGTGGELCELLSA